MTVTKYEARVRSSQSMLCVGLDSTWDRLPERFRHEPHPQFAFNRWIIAETHAYASAYKPNLAFYEARGHEGLHDLKLTTDYLREHHPDIYLIGDAKRADIGSTNEGYCTALFDWFGFDAVTLHPYLGHEVLRPFLEREDKACIILCRTSNPGAGELQDLMVDGKPLWQHVALSVRDVWNAHGNCMLVVGATYPDELRQIRALVGDMTLLVPGVGAQGGDLNTVLNAGQNSVGQGLIINASRSIIFAASPAQEAAMLAAIIRQHLGSYDAKTQ